MSAVNDDTGRRHLVPMYIWELPIPWYLVQLCCCCCCLLFLILLVGAWSLEALPSGWLDWPCSMSNMTQISITSNHDVMDSIEKPKDCSLQNPKLPLCCWHEQSILLIPPLLPTTAAYIPYTITSWPCCTRHVTQLRYAPLKLHHDRLLHHHPYLTMSAVNLSLSLFIYIIYFVSNHTTAFDCTKCDCIIRIHFGQWITTGLGQRGHNVDVDTDQGRFARGERGDCSVDRSRRGITRWWDRIVRDDDPFGLARGGDL